MCEVLTDTVVRSQTGWTLHTRIGTHLHSVARKRK